MASAKQASTTPQAPPDDEVVNTVIDNEASVTPRRFFTIPGRDPFDEVDWELRDALIPGKDGPAFEQRDVEFPKFWSQTATNIVAQKYFRGRMASPERERSVKQMVGRVADSIAAWGRQGGYFATEEEGDTFHAELKAILVNQIASFNSPVWFNVGFEETPQCSACFILSIDDSMESILDWIRREGIIFRGGSGSGFNLSRLRSSKEQLSKGGYASGPVSFMRGADASAGTIKSGGKTRRAAKMVVLDIGHPDVDEFIWCKAKEERKARVLEQAGYDMSLDSPDWALDPVPEREQLGARHRRVHGGRHRGQRVGPHGAHGRLGDRDADARALLKDMAAAAWECADPGVQYDTTINTWHTSPNTGRINASNPCSEYMHVDDSACNLSSLNLLKFRKEDGEFDVEMFEHAVDVMFLAQEIIVGYSSYPTPEIGRNALRFRQLGLGYANLGALLMARGLPYDSDEGRAYAAAITALMTGRGYRKSAEVARRMGPHAGYPGEPRPDDRRDREASRGGREHPAHRVRPGRPPRRRPARVGRGARDRRGARVPERPGDGARSYRDDQLHDGLRHDRRRARLLAREVEEARRRRRHHDRQQDGADGAPRARLRAGRGRRDRRVHRRPRWSRRSAVPQDRSLPRVRLRDRRAGDPLPRPREDDGRGAAVHLGRDLEDGQPARVDHGRRGRAALRRGLAARRQGDRDLPRQLQGRPAALRIGHEQRRDRAGRRARRGRAPQRRRVPEDRTEVGRKFRVGDYEGYIHVGLFEDGTPGDIFVDIAKEGTTLAGLMNSFMISVSLGLQYGVPLEVYVSKFSHMRFEPSGLTNDADIRAAKSIVDYIFRWMGKKFLTADQQEEAGILTPEVKARLAAAYAESPARALRLRPSSRRPRPDGALQPVGGRRRVRPLRRPHGADGQLLHLPRLRNEHRLQLSEIATAVSRLRDTAVAQPSTITNHATPARIVLHCDDSRAGARDLGDLCDGNHRGA